MKKILISLIAYAVCANVLAQTVMKDLDVTAKRRLEDTGVERTRLDTTVLHDNISLSMADILNQQSTLFIKSYGRATEATAEFRGTSPSHTQVMWNGMRINSPMLGTVDFSTIPAYFIDQADLYHGASSINLTGGGLGGAVDLRSMSPIRMVHEDRPFCAQFVQGVGSYGTFDEFVRLCYGPRRWKGSTRVVFSQSDNDFHFTNYDKKVDQRDELGQIVSSYHPTERNRSGYFKEVHALQDIFGSLKNGDRLTINSWLTHSLRGLPFLSVDYKDGATFSNEQKLNTLRTTMAWNHQQERWATEVRGGHSWQDVAYDYTTSRQELRTDITHSRSHSHTAFVQAEGQYFPSEQLMLTAKVATYYHHVKSEDRSPFHIGNNFNKGRTEYNASLALRWRPWERFSLSGIVREEGFGKDWIAPIPALFADIVLYRPWGIVLKGSVARNYRYPSMDDLYFQPGGNPDLRPEKGLTYDGGVEFGSPQLGRTKGLVLKGNVTAFDSYITDWILWTPNAKGFWQPANVKKVHNYGVEARLEAEARMGRDWRLTASGNMAWTPSINKGKEINSNDASYGKQLCYVPRFQANITAKLAWRSWALCYKWNHYSERFTTTSNEVNYITGRLLPYYMSDVSMEKSMAWRHLDASVKVAVNNLLSTEYVTVLSRPMAPRNFEVYLKLEPKW